MHCDKEIQGHTIIYSEYKYNQKQYNIEMLLGSDDFKDFINKLDQKYNIVIGGDGTMLYALNNYYKNKKSFIGINFGNKGFLLHNKNIIFEDENYIEKKYSIFQVKINSEAYKTFINELSLTALAGKMGSFNIKIGDRKSFDIHGDGLIVATSLGSTAYNSSLGGPIVFHDNKSLILTSKASWKPKNMPSIVLNETEKIEIKNTGRFHGLDIYCDGQGKSIEENQLIITIEKINNITLNIHKNHIKDWEDRILDF